MSFLILTYMILVLLKNAQAKLYPTKCDENSMIKHWNRQTVELKIIRNWMSTVLLTHFTTTFTNSILKKIMIFDRKLLEIFKYFVICLSNHNNVDESIKNRYFTMMTFIIPCLWELLIFQKNQHKLVRTFISVSNFIISADK